MMFGVAPKPEIKNGDTWKSKENVIGVKASWKPHTCTISLYHAHLPVTLLLPSPEAQRKHEGGNAGVLARNRSVSGMA
jgi:hypothetical protein